jgi:hypothetical protein
MPLRTRSSRSGLVVLALLIPGAVLAAVLVVPPEIQQPGTQPQEVSNLESPDKCDNCHGNYNSAIEPAFTWRGGMMAQAGRDPIFWATVAVAEQDFAGSGDLCLRCHSPEGWVGGRSTPTDGSGLQPSDANGVACDLCHKMTNPDRSEHLGAQYAPFVASDGSVPAKGYFGSGMYVLWSGSAKLGPYQDASARHQFMQSRFHRSVDFCGTCHDVSNAAVGDLALGNGAQVPLAPGTFSGTLGTAVTTKAAFNNFPFQYGVVERTFSEHRASALSHTRVRDYPTLPPELRGGALRAAYDSAVIAGTGGDYEDGTPRYFTCQTCHVRPVAGVGSNKNSAVRRDLPLHDMTGGNYWMADAIKWLDARGRLRLGGGLTSVEAAAMTAGQARAMKQLAEAVSISVSGDVVKLVNQTGHKVISGYPEGRRMWLDVKWYDAENQLVREDGAYGPITANVGGLPLQVNTLLDPADPNTRIYESHYAMTQEWAAQLVSLGYPLSMALSYDRVTGGVAYTLGDLAAQAPGTHHETFHFVLNNTVVKDNRIPPYGFAYDEARRRNALPVPATQYGDPGPGGVYRHWDEVTLNPPEGATYATVDLLYQPTSWEYVQFLYLANAGGSSFLGGQGQALLDAWLATGMAAPYKMASATWGTPPVPASVDMYVPSTTTWTVAKSGALGTQTSLFSSGSTVGVKTLAVDAAGMPLSGVQVFVEVLAPGGGLATSLQGYTDMQGSAVLKWKTSRGQAAGTYTVRTVSLLKNGYTFNAALGQPSVTFTVQ